MQIWGTQDLLWVRRRSREVIGLEVTAGLWNESSEYTTVERHIREGGLEGAGRSRDHGFPPGASSIVSDCFQVKAAG
jgi:hypothetical protein